MNVLILASLFIVLSLVLIKGSLSWFISEYQNNKPVDSDIDREEK